MTEGSNYAAAEWMSGWIALSFLNDPLIAKDHFHNFFNNVNYPISTSRGAFWLGRTYEKLGDRAQSNKWYQEASKYLTTYYGQLAFLKLNPNEKFVLNKDMLVDNKYRYIFFNKELVKIVYLLNELKKDKVSLDKDFYVFTGSTVGVVPILGKGLYVGKVDQLGSAKAIIH